MGLYRILNRELTCAACGAMFVSDLQFKAGDDGLQTHHHGQPVSELPEGTLVPARCNLKCRHCMAAAIADMDEAPSRWTFGV